MEIIYKAFDGKIFDDEDDCLCYEKILKLQLFSKDIICLDEKGKLIPIEDNLDDVLEQATFLKIQTDEAASFILSDYGYIIGDSKKGLFYYDENLGGWADFRSHWKKVSEEFIVLNFILKTFS